MTSTSPYKSKLFNFLNRQSIQWNTRLSKAARRLKITVEWGAQIAVYPLYLLVQSSRVATRQLAAARSQQQQHRQPAIAPVAATIVPGDMTEEILTLNAPNGTTAVELQGLACELTSQKIFFVDRHNQLIAPDQSQDSIQKQISLHLSNFNYQKRRQRQASLIPQKPTILPPVQPHNPTLFAPVRWLLQGISWLEQSPVAIALDLFGESNWRTAIIPLEIYSPKLLPPLPLEPILNPLDDRVAAIEAKLLKPASETATEPGLPPLKRFFQKFLPQSPNPDHPQPIGSSSKADKTPINQKAWLTWTDLFQPKPHNPPPLTPKAPLNQAIAPTPTRTTDLTPFIAPNTELTKLEPKEQSLVPNPQDPGQNSEFTITIISDPQQNTDLAPAVGDRPATDIEAKPEWIETEALSVGYDQHFLEKILKKVDQIMAWVEQTISKIWSKLH
ncbi:hypothetical protein [[Limnothrix rosea] IAM M-220]|uniref:hypothetical protein n=1 Tax=[Limnothrix rosea] IAM M-220 TaxID=454133 RepID=UPI001115AB14|nr:hypothetical protein [[Limnothrix rosea] IAM M-220]